MVVAALVPVGDLVPAISLSSEFSLTKHQKKFHKEGRIQVTLSCIIPGTGNPSVSCMCLI